MATTAEIRAALKGGPLKPSQIADQLGITEADERTSLYQAIRQLVVKERGVEQLDDGTVTLIPNWKPTRGASKKAEKPSRKPKAAKAKRKQAGGRKKAIERVKAPRKPPGRRKAAAEAIPAQATAQAATAAMVPVPLPALRALVAHAMRGAQPLDAVTRQAVLDVVKEAA